MYAHKWLLVMRVQHELIFKHDCLRNKYVCHLSFLIETVLTLSYYNFR